MSRYIAYTQVCICNGTDCDDVSIDRAVD